MVKRVLFHNSSAGSGASLPDCLSEFESHEIAHLDSVLKPLLSADPSDLLVAVWGGDGSVRSAAKALAGTNATLLVCPGGTHNHFAKAIGMYDEAAVEAALLAPDIRLVDVGAAGSEVFVNNFCIGWYTDLVARRERHQKRLPRKVAKATSVTVQLFRTRRLRICVDGNWERVWLVWVGNGEFSLDPSRLAEREATDANVLDIRLLRAGVRLPKVQAVIDLLRGNTESSPHIVRHKSRQTRLQTRTHHIRAALDGELVFLESPTSVTVQSKALRVLVPLQQRATFAESEF
jgi:diacylglycerol kinase family enzyme